MRQYLQRTQGGVVHSSPLSHGWQSCTAAVKAPFSPLYTPYPYGQSCSRKIGPSTVQFEPLSTGWRVSSPLQARPGGQSWHSSLALLCSIR